MSDIVLVTCNRWPAISASDAELARELSARGHNVRGLPWNGAPIGAFTSADLVVLRSNWDFHHDPSGFERWLDEIDRSDVELRNPAELVRPMLDKRYLNGLAAAGFRTPITLITENFDLADVISWTDDHALHQLVIKPLWGASGHGVELASREDLPALADRWRQDPERRPLLIQEFVPEVRNGEHALVFFKGEFSHALLRAASDDFRVNSQYGGVTSAVTAVDPSIVEFGRKVEAALPEIATYARIDVVSNGTDHVLMEVEINEPGLGLDLAPGSAARFAAALLD
ncbi:MAG: hypothetical protein AAF467_14890 [Actinomycetota bacterium]